MFKVINKGYKILLLDNPKPAVFTNNSCAMYYSTFVKTVSDFLQSGKFLEVKTLPHVIRSLSVAEPNSGKNG